MSWFGCWTQNCQHLLQWQSEHIGSWKKPNFSCSHKAHWGAVPLCQGETLSKRDQLGLCADTRQPHQSIHKGAFSWEVWSFLQSFVLASLCGLITFIVLDTSLYIECQLLFTASLPRGICWYDTVVMCVNTLRTAGALFPSLGGFFPRALYICPSSF